jgi:hypothetical protein
LSGLAEEDDKNNDRWYSGKYYTQGLSELETGKLATIFRSSDNNFICTFKFIYVSFMPYLSDTYSFTTL